MSTPTSIEGSRQQGGASIPAMAAPDLRILLVDDHPITRQGLRALLEQQIKPAAFVEADSAAEALALLDQARPTFAIVDVGLKSSSGLDLTKALKTALPDLPVLVVSMHDEAFYAERALRAGAMGYVMKQEVGDKVVAAIQQIVRGELYLSPRMKEKILHTVARKRRDGAVFTIDTLSERELQVFRLLGDGYGTREIARRLNVSVKTIDSYREHLKLKLGLANGTELVQHAISWAASDAA
jgi:DNA-binding NarL/FixJ family response regulator